MSHPRVQTMLLCKSKYPCEPEISLENERQEYKVMQGCVGFFFFFFNTVEPQLAVTSLQLPCFCVPKVTVAEMFDYNCKAFIYFISSHFFYVLWVSKQIYNLSNC